MKIIETSLPGVMVLEPRIFGDKRGLFLETYREDILHEAGINERFVQDNQSRSRRGVLRGLHYQLIQPRVSWFGLLEAKFSTWPWIFVEDHLPSASGTVPP
jgi:dTDP-4-dehydrorhamnose 3,5-epimerase